LKKSAFIDPLLPSNISLIALLTTVRLPGAASSFVGKLCNASFKIIFQGAFAFVMLSPKYA
jgi:hypothetical protein